MKTDKLENFVIENRDQFDTMEPSPDLWQKIEPSQTNLDQYVWVVVVHQQN